jgi:hypothetical protein
VRRATFHGVLAGVGLVCAACDSGIEYGYRDTTGLQCGSIGDVDGDGVEDLAVAMRFDPTTGADESRLLILSGKELEPLVLLLWPAQEPEQGRVWELASRGIAGGYSLGDLDGDGRSDFALKERFLRRVNPDVGRMRVIAGGDWRLLHEDGPSGPPEPLVRTLQDVGDLDGDGTPEHARVLEPEYYDGLIDDRLEPIHATALRIRSGREFVQRLETASDEPWCDLGAAVARTSDRDADGTADLLVADPGRNRVLIVAGRDGSVLESFEAPDSTYAFGSRLAFLPAGGTGDRSVALVQGRESSPFGLTIGVYRMPSFERLFTFAGQLAVLGDVDGDQSPDWAAWTRDPRDLTESIEVRTGAGAVRIWRRHLEWSGDPRTSGPFGVPDAWISSSFELQGTADVDRDGLREVVVSRSSMLDFERRVPLEARFGEVLVLHGRTGATLRHLTRATFAELEARCPSRVQL